MGFLLAMIFLFLTLAAPQKPASKFEVASIKLNNTGDGSSTIRAQPGGWTAVNVTVMQIVRSAFQVQEFQMYGQPSWFSSQRYDIEAKAPSGVAIDKAEVWQPMVHALLAERFDLVYHKEIRELPVYALVAAKGGHKLKKADPKTCVQPPEGPCGGFNASSRQIMGDHVSMDAFAVRLGRSMGRIVMNKTDVEGIFDLLLQWTPEGQDGDNPSIYTALQEQLGLRLESTKGPVEVFVIDRVERPSEN
jgi:uncharacterized protein (TIGR03435 family)